MRRPLVLLSLMSVLTGGLVALPIVTSATATPRPVTASLQQLPLTTVDTAASLRTAPGRRSLLSPQSATRPFSLMGVTWRDDDAVGEVEVLVRIRTGGRWTPWESVEAERADAPDDGSVDTRRTIRAGSAPVWTGPSDGVQARVSSLSGAAPQDVRIELVDPGTSPADEVVALPRDTASAAAPQPAIVTRAQWGADESIRRGSPSYNRTVKVGFVHHTASSNTYTADQAAAMVRGIYAYHVKSNGWSDIGYNFLVDRYGRAYEGRAGGIDRYVVGAHTGGFNTDSFGVSLLGDFSTVAPSTATVGMLSKVLAWKLGSAYRDPKGTAVLTSAGGGTSKYSAGAKATFDVVSGHRDAGSTSCPGATTYARMPAIRDLVQADLGAGFVEPSINQTVFPLASRGPVTVSATTLGPVSWTATVLDAKGAALRTVTGSDPSVAFSWDLTADGRPVPAGSYAVRLSGRAGDDTALGYSAQVVVDAPVCRGTPIQRAVCQARQRAALRTAPAAPPGS
ncbi:MAG: N-acetylmuramoyl-L-alanine amidase, family 2 [Frankiales bacterium]|nr:N-acetylmuramoyl-L-alanine amidase, family 2 [Frankiales bacterium]